MRLMINKTIMPTRMFSSEGRCGGYRPLFTAEPVYSSRCSGTVSGNGRHGVDDYHEVMQLQQSGRAKAADYTGIGPIGVVITKNMGITKANVIQKNHPAVITENDASFWTGKDPELEFAAQRLASQRIYGFEDISIFTDPVGPGHILLQAVSNCLKRLAGWPGAQFDKIIDIPFGPFSFDITDPFKS